MPPPAVVLHALHGHRVHEDAMYVHDVHEDVLNSFTDPIETMKMGTMGTMGTMKMSSSAAGSAASAAASAASASGTIAHMGSIGSVKDFNTFHRLRAVRESLLPLLPSPPTFVPPKTEESRDSMNAKFGSVLRGVQSNQMDKLRRMHDVSRFTDPVHRHGQVREEYREKACC